MRHLHKYFLREMISMLDNAGLRVESATRKNGDHTRFMHHPDMVRTWSWSRSLKRIALSIYDADEAVYGSVVLYERGQEDIPWNHGDHHTLSVHRDETIWYFVDDLDNDSEHLDDAEQQDPMPESIKEMLRDMIQTFKS